MDVKCCYGCMNAKRESPLCEHCGYDERTQNAPHQLPTGTILQGKYLLGRVLGQGGFGITYLGRDIALDIPVAIKEYYPTGVVTRESSYSHSVSLATGTEDTRFAENRDRFLREARTLARLEDVPEVVQVKSFFTENNTAYIVMGYVKGITLKEHMRRSGGKLSPREVFRLLEPVIAALGQVHELGLVHRDISPDNIMLQPNKRARLIDFGAAHTATLPGGTSTQAVLKHGFAPVEQYQSKGHLGSWTDVYAMCATIYHCVTGLMPPNATDRMMGEEDFRWEALSCLTEIQQAALRQGLELNYRQRIQTMEELCAKLFSDEEPAAQPAPIPKPEPVPQPEPTPMSEPKPQPKPAEPPVSETGTIALIRENIDNVPTVLTAPVVQKEPTYTTPVQRSDSYTAPAVQKQPAEENKQSQPTPAEPEQKPKKKPWIWIAAGVLAGLLLLFVSIPPATPQSAPQTAQPVVPQYTDPNEPQTIQETYGSRVLMNPDLRQSAFQTGVDRKDVLSITFLNTEEAPEKAVDVSQKGDGSVVAWTEAVAGGYDLYLAANGPIILPQDCSYMFANFSALTELDMSGLDTGNVTDMSFMFRGCSKLTELDVSGFDTGNVTDMNNMFNGCTNLTGLDVLGFDTGKVTGMSYMFHGCSNLTGLDVSGFDTGKVTDMSYMFYGCSNLTGLDVSGFDTGKVTDMSYMFYGCSNLTGLDVSGFDTRKVTDMSYMFRGCSKLTELDVSGFDTRNMADMSFMFCNCSNLTELDVSGFDTGNVTHMRSMFYGCSNLTGLDVSGFDTGNVIDMNGMFYYCSNLTELDVSGLDTGNVTDMGFMFNGCSNLTGLDVSGFDTGNVTDMRSMFLGTDKLKNVNGNFDVRNIKQYSQYSDFMDSDDTFNGRTWWELFQ